MHAYAGCPTAMGSNISSNQAGATEHIADQSKTHLALLSTTPDDSRENELDRHTVQVLITDLSQPQERRGEARATV
jgi:hypothetical protein